MRKILKFISKKITPIKRREDSPWMVRYTILDWGFIAIKVHNILQSDDDCMHDHPWTFISFILKGGYVEETEGPNGTVDAHYYRSGSILYRPARHIHSLKLSKPAWTLVITFKKVRQWGFWTKRGWVPHNQYTATGGCDK